MRHLIVFAGLAWPLVASAQPSLPIPVDSGAPIRVLVRTGASLEGNLGRRSGDSIVLRRTVDRRPTDTTVFLGDVSTVAIKVRRHLAGATWKGLGIGVLSGGLVGAALAANSIQHCTGELCGLAVLDIPTVGLVGGMVGLVVGRRHTSERWETIWPPDPARP